MGSNLLLTLAKNNGAFELADALQGKVVFPGDEQYDAARQGWNLTLEQRPEMIVFVETPQDVVEAMKFARQHDLAVAVQATGHGTIGQANWGAMLINTSHMNAVKVDPEAQTAWVEGGVKWGKVLGLAQQFGLAPLLGSSTDVGAVGYSLGGGLGWLARKYGLSSDSILRLEVVTPDGVLRTASPEKHSDLFWALRGGGGGFGVVTGMEIRLYPVTQVYAGNLLYPQHMAKEVFRRFRQWVANAPDELTASIVLMNYPPLPEIPPMLRGQSFVIVRGAYTGAMEDGEKLLKFWREWQAPVVDDFKTIPFSAADSISQDPVDPMPAKMTGAWLKDLTDDAAEALIHYTLPQGGPPAVVFTEVRLIGGAVRRVDPDSSAYSHRDGQFLWVSIAAQMRPEMGEKIDRQLEGLRAALTPNLTGQVYMNFLDGQEARRRTRLGFSEQKFRRLQAIKAKYDPDDRMSLGYDIPPAKA